MAEPIVISFNNIPPNVRTPGVFVEIDNSYARQGLPGMPTTLMIFGQMLSGGSATALTPYQVRNPLHADNLFVRGSMLARTAAAVKANNPWHECWAVAIPDDVASTAAAGAITFGGTTNGSGTASLGIGGRRAAVAVKAGVSLASLATATAALINADAYYPVTAAVNGTTPSQVDLTAKHPGLAGNAIDLRVGIYPEDALPRGLSVTVTPMAGGTLNPSITPALALFGDEWYSDLVLPYTDAANLAAVEGEADGRYGPMTMQDMHVWCAAAGTHAALTTLGNSRNSPHITIIGAEASPTPPEEWAGALGGLASYKLAIDPARPLQHYVLKGIMPPARADWHTRSDRNNLLHDGIATYYVARDGDVMLERAITTYQTTAQGTPDDSYLDSETMRTLAYLRYSTRVHMVERYPNHKIASDGTRAGAGQAIVTPRRMRDSLIGLAMLWEQAGAVENIAQYKRDILVARNPQDPSRMDCLLPPDIVNGLRVIAAQIQFRL